MSRCFPFPPPGYLRKTDALIEESIKIRLDLDLEKPKKERKEKDKKEKEEKKREKEEKKREKKEKKEKRKRDKEHKHKDSTSSHATVGIKFKFIDVKESEANGKLQKVENHENEQLERSGLTEEHGQPVSSPQEPCTSDSSQSSKRKRDSLLPSEDNGPPIKIRLPLRKHQEPEESKQGFQLGSSSRTVGLPSSHSQEARTIERPPQAITKVESKQGFQLGSSSRSVVQNSHSHEARPIERPPQAITKVESKQGFQLGSSSRSGVPNSHSHEARTIERPLQAITKVESKPGFQLGSSSRSVVPNSHSHEARRVERPLQGVTKTETTNQLHGNPASKVCKPLQNLAPVNAKPANETVNKESRRDKESRRVEALYKSLHNIQPVTYDGLDSLDQDWLFSSVPKEAIPVAKKQKTDAFQCSKSLWPRAQYMPEIDIYALPYTVPF
ncbi:hypothetical protein L195_g000141 [Trifolium pratense]|uniref:Uncharacterized protein n=1 Tax=Trifolium pratense TaxID=57577 RepID=A0A2K3NL39_TRIPR|nr:DNA ligase 1-like [Trifolium pratense]PNY03733.1 hypothetical protein L195_g000141 [Trifolium pratense]